MRLFGWLFLIHFLWIPFDAFAFEATVSKVKNNKAMIEFKGVDLKPGDKLSLSEPNDFPEFENDNSTLQKREHSLNLEYRTILIEIDNKKEITGSLNLEYERIFGRFNLGFQIGSDIKEYKDSNENNKQTVPFFGISAAFNFIDEKSMASFIPYAAVQLTTQTIKNEYSPYSQENYTVDSKLTIWSLGLKWYPLDEIFAFNLSLPVSGRVEYSSSGNKISGNISGLNLGTSIVF